MVNAKQRKVKVTTTSACEMSQFPFFCLNILPLFALQLHGMFEWSSLLDPCLLRTLRRSLLLYIPSLINNQLAPAVLMPLYCLLFIILSHVSLYFNLDEFFVSSDNKFMMSKVFGRNVYSLRYFIHSFASRSNHPKRLSIVKTGSFLFAFEIVYSFVISSHLGHRAKPIYCESEASNWKQTWAGGKKKSFQINIKMRARNIFFHLSDNQKKTSLYTFSRHRSLSVSSFFLPSTNSQKSFDSVTDL